MEDRPHTRMMVGEGSAELSVMLVYLAKATKRDDGISLWRRCRRAPVSSVRVAKLPRSYRRNIWQNLVSSQLNCLSILASTILVQIRPRIPFWRRHLLHTTGQIKAVTFNANYQKILGISEWDGCYEPTQRQSPRDDHMLIFKSPLTKTFTIFPSSTLIG